jgi:hypothetical protein
VEISGAARELSTPRGDVVSRDGSLTPERMREVLDRIARGFYESLDVQEELLQELAKDMGINLSGS